MDERAREASYGRIHNVGINYETDLAAAAVIYIDSLELIFNRKFRIRAVWRAFRTENRRKRHCYNLQIVGMILEFLLEFASHSSL